ncbi:aminoglycoside phosphotransferase [Fibrella aquatilis]|uniref:Aminoglycoside phosphotransferase n=1 Tax=Fibrella aquatilis TaxID=2817059 RepID=A0A939G1H8_9BACT|nr:aminoglycoside phosphotransferase [Fibrella aquatilis]MBO0929360.1 aminoglycoside phosphotransferase [Fibrella aquatilis]
MIRLYPPALSQPTADSLVAYGQQVVDAGNYTAQVAEAAKRFKQYNTQQNRAFAEVRKHLGDMCCGPRRCHYCEDSVADEVEHMAPKSLYPDRAFSWDNYCYACGPCNGPKNNKYTVFRHSNPDSLYKIPPHPDKALVLSPPPAGVDALIDPRRENPLAFMMLDLGGGALGFRFSELDDDPDSRDFKRANYTIEVLHLNTRTELVRARRLAYTNFRARLQAYIHERDNGATSTHLADLQQHIQDESHQTVWQEMKRQYHIIPELTRLFAEAPEALGW